MIGFVLWPRRVAGLVLVVGYELHNQSSWWGLDIKLEPWTCSWGRELVVGIAFHKKTSCWGFDL